MSLHVVRAVALIDCDGVLVDSDASGQRSWRRWAERHGLDGTAVQASARGRRSIDTIRAVAPHLDAGAEDEVIEQLEVEDASTVTALPGARALTTSAGLRWALVTSGARRLAISRLVAAGLPVPAVVVAGDDLAHGKPDPEGYLLAAARLGVDADDCVVIEDADPGIDAGLAAGCRVLVVGSWTAPRDDPRVTSIATLEGLTIDTSTPGQAGGLSRTW